MGGRCKNMIEDERYMSNPDALVFLIKEFKAEVNKNNIKIQPNPLLVAKLDIPVSTLYNKYSKWQNSIFQK